MLNLFYTDVFFLSSLLISVTVLGNGTKENLLIAFIVGSSGLYAVGRYFFINHVHSIFERKALIVWLIFFFSMYLFYGNFYRSSVDPLGGNDAAAVFILSALDVLFIISPYSTDKLLRLLEYAFFITFVFYIVFFINILMSMSIEELWLYRLGNLVDGVPVLKGDSNTVSVNMIIFSIFIYVNVFFYSVKVKYIFSMILSLATIVFSGSKTGLFSVVLYFLLFGLVFSTPSLKKTGITLLFLVLFVVIIFSNDYLYLLIGQRVEDFLGTFGLIEYTNYSNSTNVRMDMNDIGISMWLDSPFFGNGRAAFREYSGFQTWSHNNYIEILTSFGILGLITFYWYQVLLLFKALYLKGRDNVGTIIVAVYYIVSFFIDITSVRYALYITVIMIVVTGVLISNAENKRNL